MTYINELRRASPKIDLTRYVKKQLLEKIFLESKDNNMSVEPAVPKSSDFNIDDLVPEAQSLHKKLQMSVD